MNQYELLTPDQVADTLKVTVGTLDNWRQKNYGPKHIKLGPSSKSPVRYRRIDVEAWVKQWIEPVSQDAT
jgi:predicted DNA-binding transcriptional regulator AlpA